MSKFDFVALGDITTDAFIKLQEAQVECNAAGEPCRLSMEFATKLPYESATIVPAVGNSPNAAVAAARLGLATALITDIGDDYHGQEALAALTTAGVATNFVNRHAGRKTNYHYVLWYQDERTILIKHEEYPYALPAALTESEPAWLYLSSLGGSSENFHDTIADYLEAHPAVQLAFQPGTFQMKLGAARLARIYARTAISFCNVEEARLITNDSAGDIATLLGKLHTLGPKMVVVTDGPRGACASDGTSRWFMPPYPDPAPPFERTGAGDACSSTITAALALGLPLVEALRWGPINSMSVVQKIGAQAGLLGRAELEKFLADAPADYQPRAL